MRKRGTEKKDQRIGYSSIRCSICTDKNGFVDNKKKKKQMTKRTRKNIEEDRERTELVPGSFPGGLHY